MPNHKHRQHQLWIGRKFTHRSMNLKIQSKEDIQILYWQSTTVGLKTHSHIFKSLEFPPVVAAIFHGRKSMLPKDCRLALDKCMNPRNIPEDLVFLPDLVHHFHVPRKLYGCKNNHVVVFWNSRKIKRLEILAPLLGSNHAPGIRIDGPGNPCGRSHSSFAISHLD